MIATRPNLFFLCMHKAASTFVADVLFNSLARRTAEYDLYHVGSFFIRYMQETNRPIEVGGEQQRQLLEEFFQQRPIPKSNVLLGRVYPSHMEIIEQHLESPLPNPDNRLLVMRRDPRDAIVSLYYSLSKSHNPDEIEGNRNAFLNERQFLQEHTVCEGIKRMIRLGYDTTIPEFKHCAQIIIECNEVADLSYELLIEQPYIWLAKFVDFADIGDIVDDDWYDQMAIHLEPPEIEDPSSHKRRMRPGNWRDVFDDELVAMFKERIGPELNRFHYSW